MGGTIIGAGSAHAVASAWQCYYLTPSYPPNTVAGSFCEGSGGGTGWFILEPEATIEYRCTSFTATLEYVPCPFKPYCGPYYDVTGAGCDVPET